MIDIYIALTSSMLPYGLSFDVRPTDEIVLHNIYRLDYSYYVHFVCSLNSEVFYLNMFKIVA